jgi:hypothetical protein
MKNKEFDCVEMKHRAAEKIGEKLKNYSSQERLFYWNKRYNKIINRRPKMKVAE